ncbi:CKLF factor, partial [Urocolius indicus]|nr:CKLF factor [Urocolius indicus]
AARAFPSPQLVAFGTFIAFAASRSDGAYAALAAMETAIPALFLLLYLLKLHTKIKCVLWPVADVFNSLISALFLFTVCLFAIIFRDNNGTLAGGVLGLLLLVLCVADGVALCKKISFQGPRGRTPEN